jgi:hypothetical protein
VLTLTHRCDETDGNWTNEEIDGLVKLFCDYRRASLTIDDLNRQQLTELILVAPMRSVGDIKRCFRDPAFLK